MPKDYIIVGRQPIAHGHVKYLYPNEIDAEGQEVIDKAGRPGGIPLTAEFIGDEIITLSENGALPPGSDAYNKTVRRIKNALAVVTPQQADTTEEEREAILQNTQVDLIWESRDTASDPDSNMRTFVVPVPDTLARKRKVLEGFDKSPGFEPPLTYTIDRLMMTAFLNGTITEMIKTLRDEDGDALPDPWIKRISDGIQEQLASYNAQVGAPTDLAQESDANILEDPVSAFNRAVGIYITNMCD